MKYCLSVLSASSLLFISGPVFADCHDLINKASKTFEEQCLKKAFADKSEHPYDTYKACRKKSDATLWVDYKKEKCDKKTAIEKEKNCKFLLTDMHNIDRLFCMNVYFMPMGDDETSKKEKALFESCRTDTWGDKLKEFESKGCYKVIPAAAVEMLFWTADY